MKSALRSVILTSGIAAVAGCGPAGESDYRAAVTNAVSDANARVYVLCEVRAAVWGDYDATVELEAAYSSDKKPRILKVKRGRVFIESAPKDVSTRVSKAGLAKIASKEDAFAKGVPFYIGDARFEAPDSLLFVVTSNPATKIERAAPRIQLVRMQEGPGYTSSVEIVDSKHPLASAAEPQTVTFKGNRLKDWVLSLVTTDAGIRCLASNELELSFLAPK